MTDTLRDKLIQKGWVTEFNATTLVCLIEEHCAELAKPVSVSERLPGSEDCDAEGLCWVWNFTAYTWGMFRLDLTAHSHWLPAHALPLP